MEESLGMFLSQDQINPLERSSSPTISRKIWELPNAGADKKKQLKYYIPLESFRWLIVVGWWLIVILIMWSSFKII